MAFRPHDVPPHAECLKAEACVKIDAVPSRYVPGFTAFVTRLRCPLCQEAQDDPGLDATVACRKCGLFMHLSGERVFVWRRRAKFGGAARMATVSVALAVSASSYFAVRFAPDFNRSTVVTGTVALNGKDQSRLAWRMQP